ncbi:bacillithiol biosynthesis deacetylase BshB1 [Melghirimyces profundicolus]|uniref:Bacillithiol biosynthesis deacetylase BshB1 n=1 Tax=Melghirimyces profundicolus TaxID=1242148 RepID=A0A2T6BV56_9BACL|nr:bacillithiol biosynthesis deacetylase BshB1 [Melghirimyces profundicolus]PTX59932.1 bacillithiol biosynthesis deacetylase BshB1 [Melghirimyces profundicolus]
MEQVKILAFGAHPDDVEIGAGGILARHTAQGIRVAICDLTDGELSSNGDVPTRRQEADRAAEILGLAGRYRLGFPDRGLTGTREQIDEMVRLIRRLRPQVVLAPHWDDRHPDHTACSRLVKEAVFDAAVGKKAAEDGQEPHRVQQLFYYFINQTGKADVIVDITEEYPRKKEAILAFESQFVPGPGRTETPLNRPTYLAMVEGRDQIWGHQIGTTHGEGLVTAQPIPLNGLV